MAKRLRLAATAAKMIEALRRPGRYAQIGLLCALLNNLIVIALDSAGYHYAVCVSLGHVAVTVVAYLLHAGYTFKVAVSAWGLLRFLSASVTGFCLSMFTMLVLCDGVGLDASTAVPIATVLLFAWNYALARWAILRGGEPIVATSGSQTRS